MEGRRGKVISALLCTSILQVQLKGIGSLYHLESCGGPTHQQTTMNSRQTDEHKLPPSGFVCRAPARTRYYLAPRSSLLMQLLLKYGLNSTSYSSFDHAAVQLARYPKQWRGEGNGVLPS